MKPSPIEALALDAMQTRIIAAFPHGVAIAYVPDESGDPPMPWVVVVAGKGGIVTHKRTAKGFTLAGALVEAMGYV